MKLILLPIDERPCNYEYINDLGSLNNELEIILPPKTIMGVKKVPGDVTRLWEFIEENKHDADGFILSTELLMYGGLIPSRLHNYNNAVVKTFIDKLKELKTSVGNKPIYMSSMIMRNQQFSINDEEPDYYADYGEMIFKRSVLKDKGKRATLSSVEVKQLNDLNDIIPSEYIQDYESRRSFNLSISKELIKLSADKVLEFLVIPQDDSYPWGYSARDQLEIRELIREYKQERKVMVYPGADEVGQTLICRMLHKMTGKRTRVYPIFSSSYGAHCIPLYEDRSMDASLQSHLLAAGCERANQLSEADFVLAINSPGAKMNEASIQYRDDNYNDNNNNSLAFGYRLKQMIADGYKVAIVDKAFCNGGDIQFVRVLDQLELLDKIEAYNGWNTFCNSLGSTIAQASITNFDTDLKHKRLVVEKHILEDVVYQSYVRWKIVDKELKQLGSNYFDIEENIESVKAITKKEIIIMLNDNFSYNFDISKLTVDFPWHRMFEIDLSL